VNTDDRADFRLFACSETTQFVALFADFKTDEVRRRRFGGTSVQPTAIAIDTRARIADFETQRYRLQRRLVVVLLRADTCSNSMTAPTLGADARFYMDHIRFDAEMSEIIGLEMWHVDQLRIDVLAHVDVPRHRIPTAEERKKYNVKYLPLMLLDDPVARWLGFSIDDVIAIDLEDADMGRSVQLRRIVSTPTQRF